jgi:hypothetical protein
VNVLAFVRLRESEFVCDCVSVCLCEFVCVCECVFVCVRLERGLGLVIQSLPPGECEKDE